MKKFILLVMMSFLAAGCQSESVVEALVDGKGTPPPVVEEPPEEPMVEPTLPYEDLNVSKVCDWLVETGFLDTPMSYFYIQFLSDVTVDEHDAPGEETYVFLEGECALSGDEYFTLSLNGFTVNEENEEDRDYILAFDREFIFEELLRSGSLNDPGHNLHESYNVTFSREVLSQRGQMAFSGDQLILEIESLASWSTRRSGDHTGIPHPFNRNEEAEFQSRSTITVDIKNRTLKLENDNERSIFHQMEFFED